MCEREVRGIKKYAILQVSKAPAEIKSSGNDQKSSLTVENEDEDESVFWFYLCSFCQSCADEWRQMLEELTREALDCFTRQFMPECITFHCEGDSICDFTVFLFFVCSLELSSH